jgi:hypothetical protein
MCMYKTYADRTYQHPQLPSTAWGTLEYGILIVYENHFYDVHIPRDTRV